MKIYKFTKEQINILRGWSLIIITISHTIPNLEIILRLILPSNIAIFIFSTGYGLIFSYNTKGKTYLENFIQEKVLYKIFIPYFIITIIKVLCTSMINGKWIFNRDLFVDWYVEFTLYVYICFYIIWKYFDTKRMRLIWTGTVSVGYVVLCLLLGKSSTWYQGMLALWFGGTVASVKNSERQGIQNFIKRNEMRLIVFSILCMYAMCALTFKVIHFPFSGTIGAEGVCLFTTASMILIIPKVWVIPGITYFFEWLGKNSYYFYLLHMLVCGIVSIWIGSIWSRCILTICITAIVVWIIERIKSYMILMRKNTLAR